MMEAILGWTTLALVLGMAPVLVAFALVRALSRAPVEVKYAKTGGGGLVGVFDSVWSPTAHEAGQERDRQQRASVPAPTPDKGPGVMDEARIIIEI